MFMSAAINDFQEQVYNDDFLMAQETNDSANNDGFLTDHDQIKEPNSIHTSNDKIQHIKEKNVDSFLGDIDKEFIEGNNKNMKNSENNNKKKSDDINKNNMASKIHKEKEKVVVNTSSKNN